MNDNSKSREDFVDLLRDYQKKVTGWFQAWTDENDFTKSEDYKKSLANYQDFKKVDNVDYAPVVNYARELFEKYDKTDKSLDEKADSVIKYLGGGSALITFGALLSIKSDVAESRMLGVVTIVSLIPSLLFTIAAVNYAIRVRRPQPAATLPDVAFARKMAEYYKNKEDIELNIFLIFSPICEAAHYRNTRKGKWLGHAHNAYQLAITFLLLPAIAVPVCLKFLI